MGESLQIGKIWGEFPACFVLTKIWSKNFAYSAKG
jgi:hypothetical protein